MNTLHDASMQHHQKLVDTLLQDLAYTIECTTKAKEGLLKAPDCALQALLLDNINKDLENLVGELVALRSPTAKGEKKWKY